MKKIIATSLLVFVIFLSNTAQKNYTVEYDKLSNKTTFFETTFKKGKRFSSQINNIELAQGDKNQNCQYK